MMRWMTVLAAAVAFSGVVLSTAHAQGTKLWTVGRYDELERGSTEGVAIRNDGRLEAAPPMTLLDTTGGNYVWSVAADRAGIAYVGTGGTTSGSATVLRVSADGKAEKVFSAPELGVQAVRVGPDGTVYAATSPDGKVYRVAKGGGTPTVIFDAAATAEKPKYLWDLAIGSAGEVYVAAGAPAVVYRIIAGKADPLFRTADQHIRCLLLSRTGMLYAGTDGSGVIYRIDPRVSTVKPFAMYAAAQREITSLAEDEAGNLYAAGVGAKGASSLPPLPVTGAVGVTVTFLQPASAGAVSASTVIPDGSELYRIAPDGTPSRLLALKEDVVYSLAVSDGALFAATGNRGRVYRIDLGPDRSGRFADVAHLEAAQGTSLAASPGGLLIATSNSGKLYRLGGPAKPAVYTSEVFDAGGFTHWGRAEVRAEGPLYNMSLRVGNVPSPAEGWSDWTRLNNDAGPLPEARFAQWKLELAPGTLVEQVALNYLPRNVAPVVDDVAVQLGARVAPGAISPAAATVQVSLPSPAASAIGLTLPSSDATTPLTAQRDRAAVTVRWAAHDDNGDDLMFSIWYRGVGERDFRLLKDKISDRFYSFDLGALPDGAYTLKVVASDAPSHPDASTLTGERLSGIFVIDTTPPVVSTPKATIDPAHGTLQATFDANDATSPIAHAEFSLDAGPWQYLEPQGGLSDGTHETYRISIPTQAAGEHVLAVRVYDRYENVGSSKVLVR